MSLLYRAGALLAVALMVVGTAAPNNRPQSPADETTLYSRLGGIGAIEGMVDDLVLSVTTDTVIMANRALARALAATDMQELRYQLVTRICEASGGPCQAPDEWPFDPPRNLTLTEAQWTRAVNHLKSIMTKYRVPQPEQDALLAVMAIAKRQLVK